MASPEPSQSTGSSTTTAGDDEPKGPSRYRVHVLREAWPTQGGISYRRDEEERLLEWSKVEYALACEVGEPEGVRTVVFDLVVGSLGRECVVLRTDAEPGDDAIEMARAIEAALGALRCSGALRSLAVDGIASLWHPDLPSFEEHALEQLRYRQARTP